MRLVLRIAAVAVAGAAIYQAGQVNGVVQLEPSVPGALFTALAVAAALGLMAMALTGTGYDDAAAAPTDELSGPVRGVFAFVALMSLVGLAWLFGIRYPPVHDPTTYHNDAITLNECAAQALLRGEDPYARLDIFACFDAREIGADRTTPLQRGPFADVRIYPSEEQLDAGWAAATVRGSPPEEFVWRLSYPALSILPLVPLVILGVDTNLLYIACLLAAMALVLARAPAGSRALMVTGLLAAASLTAFTMGGSADLLYVLPLVAAWLWRERRWSALALGASCAVKQLAWPFAAFYVLQVAARQGRREAALRTGIAAALFAVVNAPFVAWDARAWVQGILTPVSEPMFPRGAGLVFLSANGVLPLYPTTVYLALETVAAVAVLAVAWRSRHTSPELGVVLAMVPLYFAWRSLFSYFFLLPLLAFAGIARMPTGELSPDAARKSGALSVLAIPAPSGPPPRT